MTPKPKTPRAVKAWAIVNKKAMEIHVFNLHIRKWETSVDTGWKFIPVLITPIVRKKKGRKWPDEEFDYEEKK